jgi:CheY-like chemotaxis protein
MTLSALLVCLDNAAADVLRLVLEELSIRVESCPDVVRASIRLAQQRFDVVVLDCDSQAEVEGLLRETRLSRVNDSTLAVAVVSGQDSIREMFSLGVNFVLYKPVSHERALSSLRAARAVMRKEKRRSARANVHAHATVDYANVEREKATLVDLAQDGMAVLFGKKLPPTSKVYFQFQLPDQKSSVRLSGQVVWQDWNGRAGIQFVDVPKTSRRLLTEYLGSVLQQATEPFPDVTVEVEEPMAMHPVLVGAEPSRFAQPFSEPKRPEPPPAETQEEAAPSRAAEGESGARLRSEPDNRRGQARYACRVGAEVYRTGITVPTHCCLTDLSAGGCYLEVPLPFPQGSSVEITVRTYQLKIRLRGIVQTSHPGYGMGVAFDLKAKDDSDHLKKLIDFVSSAEGNPG